ncbi:MAG: bifunctional 2',3'-cyclic-nucleotide 2'-phosphodiesterase/3'-nucleotidase [Spirochaetota bacterium]
MTHKKRVVVSFLSLMLMFILSTGAAFATGVPEEVEPTSGNLTIMATSDTHQYLMPYDYMEDTAEDDIGFSKIYSLIEDEREKQENTLLLSNGDFIQGSLIGVYEYQVDPLEEGETQSIVEAYNHAGYEAAAVGNHELQDYATSFFDKAVAGADFPFLSANLVQAGTDSDHYVAPYTIIEKTVGGEKIDIGVVGFVPPQTMRWGKDHLEGNLDIHDIIQQARTILPEVEKQSDIVVVLGHTGISNDSIDSYDARENAGYYLALLDSVDALITGHQHNVFPDDYEDMMGVDAENATIFGVPTVMPGSWGGALGLIDLELTKDAEGWSVTDHDVRLREVDESVESHPEIENIAQDVHESTVEYVRTPIGDTEREINSYLSRVMDSSVTQIVNNAQLWWAEEEFSSGEYSDLPILSAAAPFKAGREDAEYFTHVSKGGATIGDITDIYIYDNQLRVMQLDGEQVIEWLERSAENFNTIDPDSDAQQELLDGDFSAYNYDVIEGIEYKIDVTQEEGDRIVEATYNGEELSEDMEFLVVTNDYRAGGGGNFPPCVEEDPVYAPSGEVNREIIMQYIEEKGSVDPEPTHNWHIKAFDPAGTVTFRSHPEAMDYVDEYDIENVEFLETDENDMGVYRLDVSNLGS